MSAVEDDTQAGTLRGGGDGGVVNDQGETGNSGKYGFSAKNKNFSFITLIWGEPGFYLSWRQKVAMLDRWSAEIHRLHLRQPEWLLDDCSWLFITDNLSSLTLVTAVRDQTQLLWSSYWTENISLTLAVGMWVYLPVFKSVNWCAWITRRSLCKSFSN